MSNNHFFLLIALILLPVFGWMAYDFRVSAEEFNVAKASRDVLFGSDGSIAQVQYLFRFSEPVYNHKLSTKQIEALSHDGGENEHYHVFGLTQADYGTETQYEVNWSKHWFKQEYDLWVENLRVDFSYNTLNVYVSNSYPEDSCGYRETLAHENQHVEIHRKIYFQFQKVLKDALANSKTLPLSSRPIVVESTEEGKKRVGEMIAGLVQPVFNQFKETMAAEQAKLDTPEEYDALKQRCAGW